MQLELFHAVYVIGGWPHPHRAAAGQAGRIKGSSGSTAQRQQPSSRAAMCYFFILAMSKHGFKKAEGNLPCCLTVPIARTGLQVGQVCSNLISSCCPKEGLMLHSGLLKKVWRRRGGKEDESMAKSVRRALILVEHFFSPRISWACCWRCFHSSSFIPLSLEWPQVSDLSHLKYRNSSNALQEANLYHSLFWEWLTMGLFHLLGRSQ